MIIRCPNCSTLYRISSDVISDEGRMMKCAKCGHEWKQTKQDQIKFPKDKTKRKELLKKLNIIKGENFSNRKQQQEAYKKKKLAMHQKLMQQRRQALLRKKKLQEEKKKRYIAMKTRQAWLKKGKKFPTKKQSLAPKPAKNEEVKEEPQKIEETKKEPSFDEAELMTSQIEETPQTQQEETDPFAGLPEVDNFIGVEEQEDQDDNQEQDEAKQEEQEPDDDFVEAFSDPAIDYGGLSFVKEEIDANEEKVGDHYEDEEREIIGGEGGMDAFMRADDLNEENKEEPQEELDEQDDDDGKPKDLDEITKKDEEHIDAMALEDDGEEEEEEQEVPVVLEGDPLFEEKKQKNPIIKYSIIAACILIAGFLGGRYQFAKVAPFLKGFYSFIGVKAEKIGEGLDIRNVSTKIVSKGDLLKLEIRGYIFNISKEEKNLPYVYIELLDDKGYPVKEKYKKPPSKKLARDVRESFLVELKSPPKEATRAVVTFAENPHLNKSWWAKLWD